MPSFCQRRFLRQPYFYAVSVNFHLGHQDIILVPLHVAIMPPPEEDHNRMDIDGPVELSSNSSRRFFSHVALTQEQNHHPKSSDCRTTATGHPASQAHLTRSVDSSEQAEENKRLKRELAASHAKNAKLAQELNTTRQELNQLRSNVSGASSMLDLPQILTRSVSRRLAMLQPHQQESQASSDTTPLVRENERLKQELGSRASAMQYERLAKRYAHVKAELKEAKALKKESELGDLQDDNAMLRESLEQCKKKIVSLQPPQRITDHEMAEKYDHFCTRVSSWVNDQVGDAENYLLDPEQHYWSEDPGIMRFLSRSISISVALKGFPRVELEWTQFLVHGLLLERIFSQREHFPDLPDSVQDFLLDLEQGEGVFKQRTGKTFPKS
jgi:hypothetical protein